VVRRWPVQANGVKGFITNQAIVVGGGLAGVSDTAKELQDHAAFELQQDGFENCFHCRLLVCHS